MKDYDDRLEDKRNTSMVLFEINRKINLSLYIHFEQIRSLFNY